MARLKLLDLRCIKSEEGGDEPYLKINGQKIWKAPYKVCDNMEVSLRSIQPIPFDGNVTVELWEADMLRDDHLGTTQIAATAADWGELEFMFTKGAKYLMVYEVWR